MEEWLRAHGFDAHVEAFAREGITLAMIPRLSDSELRELGVERIGDRHRMRELAIVGPATEESVTRATTTPTRTVGWFPTSVLPIVGMAGMAGTMLGLVAERLDDTSGSAFIGFALLFGIAWAIDRGLRKVDDDASPLERAHRVDIGSFAAQMACLLGVCLGMSAQDDEMWSFFLGATAVVATVTVCASTLTAELLRPKPRTFLYVGALVLVGGFALLVLSSVDGLAREIRWRGDYRDLSEENVEVVLGAALILGPWAMFATRAARAALLADEGATPEARTQATVHAYAALWLARCLFAAVMTLWWMRACLDRDDNFAVIGMVAAAWLPVRTLADALRAQPASGAAPGAPVLSLRALWVEYLARLRAVPAEALVDLGRQYDRSVLVLATLTFGLAWAWLRWVGDAYAFEHVERADYLRMGFVGIALFLLLVRARRSDTARPLTLVVGAHAGALLIGIPVLGDAWVMSAALSYGATRAARRAGDEDALDRQREAVAARVLVAAYMVVNVWQSVSSSRGYDRNPLALGGAGVLAFIVLTFVDGVAARAIRWPLVAAGLALGALQWASLPWTARLPVGPVSLFTLGWMVTAHTSPPSRKLWRGIVTLAALTLAVGAAAPVGTVAIGGVEVADTHGNMQLGGTITVNGRPLEAGVRTGGEAPAGLRRWTVSHPLAEADVTTWQFPQERETVRLSVNLTRGWLRIRPSRDGAPMLLDGAPVDGTGPTIVTAGEHVVSVVQGPDWAGESRTVSVEAGSETTVDVPVKYLRLDPTLQSRGFTLGDATFVLSVSPPALEGLDAGARVTLRKTSREVCGEEGCATRPVTSIAIDSKEVAQADHTFDDSTQSYDDRISEISVTSTEFRSSNGLGPGVTIKEFWERCPEAVAWYSYLFTAGTVLQCPAVGEGVQFVVPHAAVRNAAGRAPEGSLTLADLDPAAAVVSVRIY